MKTTLLTTTLLSAILMSQAASAGQAPQENRVFKDHDNSALYTTSTTEQAPRVNYSIVATERNNEAEWKELFPESAR